MDIARLRPNYLKTPDGGSIKQKRRSSGKEYISGYSNFSTDSSVSSYISASHSAGYAQVNSTHFKLDEPLQLTSKQRRYSFGKSSYIVVNSSSDENILPGVDSQSFLVMPSVPALTASTATATAWTSSGDDEVAPRFGTLNANTQTKAFNMTRVHLSGTKEHEQWKAEKADPFFDVLKKEILKNKPARIEEFLIALCKSRQDGTATPITIDRNSVSKPVVRIQSNEKVKIFKIRQKAAVKTFDLEILGKSPNGTISFTPKAKILPLEIPIEFSDTITEDQLLRDLAALPDLTLL